MTAVSAWLAVRSIAWTLLVPGIVAGYVPWRYFDVSGTRIGMRNPAHWLAVLAIAAGAGLLVMCVWHFARLGRGTLVPIDAPRRLVVSGPYRYVRNPMYLAVSAVLAGELLLAPLAAYAAIWFACVNLFVLGYEEPTLRRKFGAEYLEYTRTVRRWVPRRRGF